VKYIYLSLAVLFNVAGYMIFKAISIRQEDFVWFLSFTTALALGAVNVFFFTKALRDINFAVAYPAFSGASITLVVLVSAVIFSERIQPINLLGSATVVIGIFLLTR
jgi:multidrug transporter EmrE-like cation transporter